MARAERRRARRTGNVPPRVEHREREPVARTPPPQSWPWLAPALLVAAGIVAYHNSLRAPFIFDDRYSIIANPTIRSLWPPWKALSPPVQAAVAGRPLVNLSLAINYAVSGLDVWSYHVTNLAIHLMAGLVLFGIVRRTLDTGPLRARYGPRATALGFAVALLWLVHPLQTEAVTYVIQRTESLMGLLLLLTLYCAMRGFESPRAALWHTGALVFCALGMATKEVMVVAPVIALLYDTVFLSRSLRRALARRPVLYGGLFASWVIVGVLVAGGPRTSSTGFGHGIGPVDYAKTQAGVVLHYLRLTFWPAPLVLDYDDWPVAGSAATWLPQALVLVALLGATVAALRRSPPLGFLGAFFFLLLAPSSSVLPIVTEIAAERRMYLPLASVVAAVTIAADVALLRVAGTRAATVRTATLAAVAVPLVVLTARRNADYRTPIAAWSDVVTKRPDNGRAQMNLGDLYYRAGDLPNAERHFAEAIRVKPESAESHYGLGVVLGAEKRRAEAIAEYTEALRLNPRYPEAHNNLANELFGLGRSDEAIEHYRDAIRYNPSHSHAHFNLANMLAARGQRDEALEHYREAVRSEPEWAEAHDSLGAALFQKGLLAEAEQQYREALRLKPQLPEAHYNLAVLLTTSGHKDEAIEHLRTALRLNPGFVPARRALDQLETR